MSTKPALIAITQRVLEKGPGGYRSDVLDQAWAEFFEECGARILPVPNSLGNPREFFERSGASGLVLSGGNNLSGTFATRFPNLPDTAPERDRTESALLAFVTEKKIPVLGVCRGMQALNVFHGGNISRLEGHVRTQNKLLPTPELAKIAGTTALAVNSFHEYGIMKPDLAPTLRALAAAEDGSIEAARHPTLPQFGIMWHPEREPKNAEPNIALVRHALELP